MYQIIKREKIYQFNPRNSKFCHNSIDKSVNADVCIEIQRHLNSVMTKYVFRRFEHARHKTAYIASPINWREADSKL